MCFNIKQGNRDFLRKNIWVKMFQRDEIREYWTLGHRFDKEPNVILARAIQEGLWKYLEMARGGNVRQENVGYFSNW